MGNRFVFGFVLIVVLVLFVLLVGAMVEDGEGCVCPEPTRALVIPVTVDAQTWFDEVVR